MPGFNYAARNGMSSILTGIRYLCRIYTTFSEPIVAFINASSLSSGDKTTVISWLNAAQNVCNLIGQIQVKYER